MKSMMEVYYDEAQELLQSIEEYLIALERGITTEDINGLFRCIHSIKGSSAVAGFAEIASLAHRVEDMINSIREGKLAFNKDAFDLCFSSFDEIKKMIFLRKMAEGQDISEDKQERCSYLENKIENLLQQVKTQEGNKVKRKGRLEIEDKEDGSYIGCYFVRIFFSPGDPMPSIRRFLLYSLLSEIGSIIYSNPSLDLFIDTDNTQPIPVYECIVKTNLSKFQLLKQGNIDYVKDIQISELTIDYLNKEKESFSQNNISFFSSLFYYRQYKDLEEKDYIKLLEQIYTMIKNKIVFKVIQYRDSSSLEDIDNNFDVNSFRYLLIDISLAQILEAQDIRKIINIHRALAVKDVKLLIINSGQYKKRLYNILESIKDIENLLVYSSELEAILKEGKWDDAKL